MVLEAYSQHLSTLASFTTIPLLLSPSIICKDIIQKGSSDHVKPFVFLQGLIRATVLIQWGLLSNLPIILRTQSIGFALYTIYFTIYYWHCKNKSEAHTAIAKASTFVVILIGFVNLQPKSILANNFSHVATTVHLSLLAMPLLNLGKVIESKSTAGLPFPIILCANILSIAWLFYGLSINNGSLMFQMAVSFILTGIQLSLFVIFPSKASAKEKDGKKD